MVKKIFPILILLLVSGSLRAAGADTLFPVNHELRRLVLDKKYKKAIDLIKSRDSLQGYDYFNMGVLYSRLDRTNKSIQFLTRALTDSVPVIDGILYFLFKDYLKKKDFKTAVRIFRVMVKRESPKEVLSRVIDTLVNSVPETNKDLRLSIFRDGLQIKFPSKDKVKILTGLAKCYFNREEYDSAMTYASKVLGHGLGYDPFTGRAYDIYRAVTKIGGKAGRKEKYFLANYYYQIKQYKKSYNLIMEEMKQPRSNKKYLLLLMAKVRYRQRYYHQAKLLFQKWVDNYGHTKDVMMMQARCFRYMGYVKAANEKYMEFLETYPRASNSRDILWLMGWQNEMRGAYAAAAGYYEKLYKKFKRSNRAILAYWRRGYCFFKAKDYDRALEHWKEYRKKFTATRGKVRCLYWMGKVHLMRGARKSAARCFSSVITEDFRSYYTYKAAEQLRVLGRKIPARGPDSLVSLAPSEWLSLLDNYDKVYPDKLLDRGRLALERAVHFMNTGLDDWAFMELKILKKHIKDDMVLNYSLIKHFLDLERPEWAFLFTRTFYWKVAKRYWISMPDSLERLLYPRYFENLVTTNALQRDLEPEFVFGLIMQESMCGRSQDGWTIPPSRRSSFMIRR
jgi:tetratricopeptide (TPR) repeat protein